MHHSNLALTLLLLGSAVPSNALLRGANDGLRRERSSSESNRNLMGGSMSKETGGGRQMDAFRTDDPPDCDDLKRHPLDILDMFGVDTTPFEGTFDCNPANIRSDDCIELEDAERIYGAPARAALGIHCTQNTGGGAGVGCLPEGASTERWACLTHSKEWFCGDPLLWSGTIPLCDPTDDIVIGETELGPPLVLRKE